MNETPQTGPDLLLAHYEPRPVTIEREAGRSDILLVCDHAGRTVPRSLGRLGIVESEFDRHVAWDIGALAVSRAVSAALDAALVWQAYSRLVIDCNRPTDAASSIPTLSESTAVPGNEGLGPRDRDQRRAEIFQPYHDAITSALDSRAACGRATVLVAMHSFTPIYMGQRRPWHIGTLYGTDGRLARSLYRHLVLEEGLVVGDNEPYAVSAGSDYTIPVHGEARGLLHVGIEIRQDLVADPDGQTEWGERLARLLPLAVAGSMR